MRYTKYLFTPRDLAIFFLFADTALSREREVLIDLFHKHNSSIVYPFRKDFVRLHKAVSDLIIKFETDCNELEEAQAIMQEVNGVSTEQTTEPDYCCGYFKLVKLRLLYTNEYIKIKMSTLLSDFGYKRRSKVLVSTIKTVLKKLNIIPYTRGYEVCDIGEADIHTMIIFRLGETADEVKS